MEGAGSRAASSLGIVSGRVPSRRRAGPRRNSIKGHILHVGGGAMGGRTLARFAVVVALIGAAVGVASATPALATPPPEDPGPTVCPTVGRSAHATWMMPDGVTSAGVFVSE